jgi:hypothetical protein
MKHTCDRCGTLLNRGDNIVQMLSGVWYGAITPAFQDLLGEWCSDCFRQEFNHNAQSKPYKCEECETQIRFGEKIRFFVAGQETDDNNLVAECRGAEIYTIKHAASCPGRITAILL